MEFLAAIAAHAPRLMLGASGLLLVGCAVVAATGAPVERRRLGVLTAAALLVYLAVGLVPLPRFRARELAAADARPAPAAVDGARSPGPDDLVSRDDPHPAAVGAEPAAPAPTPSAAPERERPRLRGEPGPRPAAAGDVPTPDPRAAGAATGGGEVLAVLVALAISGGFALWLLLGRLRLWWIVHRSRPAPAWLAAGLPTHLRLRVTDQPVRPFCTGALRPVVVLPGALAAPERADAARAVLAHELAHVRAGDCRAQLLFACLLPLFWWQPLFWWLLARVRFASELLADADAADRQSVPRYVRELLALAEQGAALAVPLGASPLFHRSSEFYRRIQMLLERRVPLSRSVPSSRRLATASSAIVLVAVTALACGVPRAQEPGRAAAGDLQQLRIEAEGLRQIILDLRAQIADLQQRQRDLAVEQPQLLDFTFTPVADEAPATTSAGWEAPARNYVIQSGDSLASIAMRELGVRGQDAVQQAVQDICRRNPLLNPQRLRIGQRIELPGGSAAGSAARLESVPSGPDRVGVSSLGSSSGSSVGSAAAPVTSGGAATTSADGAPRSSTRTGAASVGGTIGGGDGSSWRPVTATVNPDPQGDRDLADLLTIVTRCIELRGEVEIAAVEREQADPQLAGAGSVRIAEIRLRTLQRQLAAAETLVNAEMANTATSLQRAQALFAAGQATDAEVRTLEARMAVLQSAK